MDIVQESEDVHLVPTPASSKAALYAFTFGLIERILAGNLDQRATSGCFNNFLQRLFHPKTQQPATWSDFKCYLTVMQNRPQQLGNILTQLNQELLANIRWQSRGKIIDHEIDLLQAAFNQYLLRAQSPTITLSEIEQSCEYLQYDFILLMFAELRHEDNANSLLKKWYINEGYDLYCKASIENTAIAGTFELAILGRYWHTNIRVIHDQTINMIHSEIEPQAHMAPITLVSNAFSDWSYKPPSNSSYWATVEQISIWKTGESLQPPTKKHKKHKQPKFKRILKTNAQWLCAGIKRFLQNGQPADLAAFGRFTVLLNDIAISGEIPSVNSCYLVNPQQYFNLDHPSADPVIANKIHAFSLRYFNRIMQSAKYEIIQIITATHTAAQQLQAQCPNEGRQRAYAELASLCTGLLGAATDQTSLPVVACKLFANKIGDLLTIICNDPRDTTTQIINNVLTIDRFLVASQPQAYANAIVMLLAELKAMANKAVGPKMKQQAARLQVWFEQISMHGMSNELPDRFPDLLAKFTQTLKEHPELYDLLTSFDTLFNTDLNETLVSDLTRPVSKFL